MVGRAVMILGIHWSYIVLQWRQVVLCYAKTRSIKYFIPEILGNRRLSDSSCALIYYRATQNFWKPPYPRPRPLFFWVWFYDGPCGPSFIPKFKSLASAFAEILNGNTQIFGSSPSPRPRPLFFCVWFYDGACGPSCVPNFKSLASAVAEILDGNPQIFGSSTSPGLRPLFLWVWFCDGPWQTPAACKI